MTDRSARLLPIVLEHHREHRHPLPLEPLDNLLNRGELSLGQRLDFGKSSILGNNGDIHICSSRRPPRGGSGSGRIRSRRGVSDRARLRRSLGSRRVGRRARRSPDAPTDGRARWQRSCSSSVRSSSSDGPDTGNPRCPSASSDGVPGRSLLAWRSARSGTSPRQVPGERFLMGPIALLLALLCLAVALWGPA